MNRWRLIFTWPGVTLLQEDGPASCDVPTVDNAMLALLGHLKNGDIITYSVDV